MTFLFKIWARQKHQTAM